MTSVLIIAYNSNEHFAWNALFLGHSMYVYMYTYINYYKQVRPLAALASLRTLRPAYGKPQHKQCVEMYVHYGYAQECIKGGEGCNCTSWMWSGRKCSFVPKINVPFHSRLQTNCEVFKWVPSTTALTTDRWLANREFRMKPSQLR